jgi:hypothetical protein
MTYIYVLDTIQKQTEETQNIQHITKSIKFVSSWGFPPSVKGDFGLPSTRLELITLLQDTIN